MAVLLPPEALENSRVAYDLIRLKLRVPIIHYLTDIHSKPLRLRWRQFHKESPHSGMDGGCPVDYSLILKSSAQFLDEPRCG